MYNIKHNTNHPGRPSVSVEIFTGVFQFVQGLGAEGNSE